MDVILYHRSQVTQDTKSKFYRRDKTKIFVVMDLRLTFVME